MRRRSDDLSSLSKSSAMEYSADATCEDQRVPIKAVNNKKIKKKPPKEPEQKKFKQDTGEEMDMDMDSTGFAGRSRREKEKNAFLALNALLPLPPPIRDQLDKAGTLRVTHAFLTLQRLLRTMRGRFGTKMDEDGENASGTSDTSGTSSASSYSGTCSSACSGILPSGCYSTGNASSGYSGSSAFGHSGTSSAYDSSGTSSSGCYGMITSESSGPSSTSGSSGASGRSASSGNVMITPDSTRMPLEITPSGTSVIVYGHMITPSVTETSSVHVAPSLTLLESASTNIKSSITSLNPEPGSCEMPFLVPEVPLSKIGGMLSNLTKISTRTELSGNCTASPNAYGNFDASSELQSGNCVMEASSGIDFGLQPGSCVRPTSSENTVAYTSDISGSSDASSKNTVSPSGQIINKIAVGETLHQYAYNLFQAMDGFVIVVSSVGKVVYVSETVAVHLGLSQIELVGNLLSDFLHPADATLLAHRLALHVRARALRVLDPLLRFTLRFRCAPGRRAMGAGPFKPIHFTGTLHACEEGRFVGYAQPLVPYGMGEMRLSMPTFMFRATPSLQLIFVDKRFTALTGHMADALLDKSLYTLIHPADVDQLREAHQTALERTQAISAYFRVLAGPPGGWLWVQCRLCSVSANRGAVMAKPALAHLLVGVCAVLSEIEHADMALDIVQLQGNKNENCEENDDDDEGCGGAVAVLGFYSRTFYGAGAGGGNGNRRGEEAGAGDPSKSAKMA